MSGILSRIDVLIRSYFLVCVAMASCIAYAGGEDLAPTNPTMSESLTFESGSAQIAAPGLGQIKIQAIASGLAMSQTNPVSADHSGLIDISNAQVIVQKDAGSLQFYVQSGYYSTPSLGTSYQRANRQTIDSFGLVPLASLSLMPSKNWLFTAGKINSFGGYENTFTFQNINIDRGLLWNQTSNVSRGFELLYSEGPMVAAITLNDGFYSNQLSWMGATASYQVDEKNTLSLTWTGATKNSTVNTFTTPLLQNNSQISNAIYTYKSGPWLVAPYLQYTVVPKNPSIGILTSAQTVGAALLTNYRFSKVANGGFSLPLRFEYIGSSGKGNIASPNLLYGAGSAAWSATITPTYQVGKYFLRGELSYVQAINVTPGQGFGGLGNNSNQARVMIEAGILY